MRLAYSAARDIGSSARRNGSPRWVFRGRANERSSPASRSATARSVRRHPSSFTRSTAMIGVFVTFRYGDPFDELRVRKIAENARAKFDGMPGLRSKTFTINAAKHEA